MGKQEEGEKMINKIKSIAKDVFNELGSGHTEAVYQKAMEVGLRLEKIPYENQRIVPIFYKEHNVGQGIPDIIINECKNGKIIIELKAVSSKLSLKEEVQLKKYMEVLNISKGVLINFPQPDSKKTPNEPEIIVIENKDEVKEYACYKCGRPIKHKGKCLNCNLKGKK